MDGTGEHYVKRSESGTHRQILYRITYLSKQNVDFIETEDTKVVNRIGKRVLGRRDGERVANRQRVQVTWR